MAERQLAPSYPRKVRCRHCGHKFTAWNQKQADSLRGIGCINCALEKMRADVRRDRRPLPDRGRRGRSRDKGE